MSSVLNKLGLYTRVISRWQCPIGVKDIRDSQRAKKVVSIVKKKIRIQSDIVRKGLVSIIMMVRGTSWKMCCLGGKKLRKTTAKF